MNSFYKKIALVCLVSLTANQAALAIQVPIFWNWMKGNQKTTAAIVAGIATCVVLLILKSKKSSIAAGDSKQIIPSDPTYTYTTFVSDDVFNNHANPIRMAFRNVKRINDLQQAEKESLEKMMPGCTKEKYGYLCVVTDDAQKKIVSAALCISERVRCADSRVCIEKHSGNAFQFEQAFRPIIETGRDIVLDRSLCRDVGSYKGLEEAIKKADDDVKPIRCIDGMRQTFFDRGVARESGCVNKTFSLVS